MNKLFTFADFAHALYENAIEIDSRISSSRPIKLIYDKIKDKFGAQENIDAFLLSRKKHVIEKAMQEVGVGDKEIPMDKINDARKKGGGKLYLNNLMPLYDPKTKTMLNFLYGPKSDQMAKLVNDKMEVINAITKPYKKGDSLNLSAKDGLALTKEILDKVNFSDLKPFTRAAGLKDNEVKELIAAAASEMHGKAVGLAIRGALNFVKF